VKPSNICLAWNYANLAVFEAIQGFALHPFDMETLQIDWEAKYQVQVLRYGSGEREKPGLHPLYWDYTSDSAVLLYRHYAVESFLVTECQHIYVKSELYRQTREAMRQPMTEGEIARVNILCEGLNCGVNLHRFAFLKGAQEARIYDEQRIYVANYLETGANLNYLQGEIASRKSRCQICSSDGAKKLCANNHFICIQCTIIISFSKYAFCCPTCGLRVKNKRLKDILARKWTIIGLKGSQTALIHCRNCKVYKDLLGFTVLKELEHDCWICDVCLLAMEIEGKPRKCEYCGDEFSKKQLKSIKNWQNDQLAQTAPGAIKAAEMGIPAKILLVCVQCQTYKAESEFQCWQKGPFHYQKCDK